MWIQLFQQFIGIYSKSKVTTGHKKCEIWNIILLKFTTSSFAFKMISAGGRGSLLDACDVINPKKYLPNQLC